MPLSKKTLLLAVGVCFLLVYWKVLSGLIADWLSDDNYSHGVLVAPLAVFIIWQRRRELASAVGRGNAWGLLVVCGSLLALVVGVLGAEAFITRVSMVGVIAGGIWFVAGLEPLRLVAFPLLLVLLTIPLPAILFNQVALPLQSLAARAGEMGLSAAGVPVLREGNVIVLATTTLEVADACSGIRSLMALFALSVLYGHFAGAGRGARLALAASAVPIAVITNGVRVAGTGLAAAHYGSEVAEGFFHSFSGWLIFIVAFGLLICVHRMAAWVSPWEVACQDA